MIEITTWLQSHCRRLKAVDRRPFVLIAASQQLSIVAKS